MAKKSLLERGTGQSASRIYASGKRFKLKDVPFKNKRWFELNDRQEINEALEIEMKDELLQIHKQAERNVAEKLEKQRQKKSENKKQNGKEIT